MVLGRALLVLFPREKVFNNSSHRLFSYRIWDGDFLKDEEIEDSATVKDDRVHDWPTPQPYQRKTPLPPKPQETANIKDDQAEKIIPIKTAEGKERFQVGAFLGTAVTLPMWQRLD